MRKIWLGLAIAGALFAGSILAQDAETPLSRLEVEDGKVGWDGLSLGMSIVQVERRTGVTLAMQSAGGTTAASGCRAYLVGVERGTLRMTLGFPSAKPGAKLQSIYVHFEGYQVTAKSEALVQELKSKVPGVAYMPQTGAPAHTEVDDPAPEYDLPGKGGYAARLVPGDGLWLTLRECLD
ncbi:MAG: hypothetical protein QG573_1238 [Acidobacteriota bacterium]|nr:hypothetical protein [Acidobacteriota bacterium]